MLPGIVLSSLCLLIQLDGFGPAGWTVLVVAALGASAILAGGLS